MSPTRREFFRSAACAAFAVAAESSASAAMPPPAQTHRRDVPWLREILAPAVPPPPAPRPLAPLLVDRHGAPITTRDGWRRKRKELLQLWRDLLGPFGAARADAPRVEVIGEDRAGDVVRRLVRYRVEPDVYTEAYVLAPRAPRARCPGAIVFHSTTRESIRQPAGLADVPEKHFGLALARRGFVAFCPRNFLWPDTTQMAAERETHRVRERHPRAKGMAKMLFDGQVALDILIGDPDVDPARIGCIGHSLGAKEALYLAAFDERVTAVVSSEGGIGLTMSNWDAPWYLGDTIREPEFAREHHELLALCAPRPFLLVGGDSADGAASWPFVAAAAPVYRLYGEPARLGLLNHKRGHAVPPDVLPRLLEWMETYA
jgi:hypothetical protein